MEKKSLLLEIKILRELDHPNLLKMERLYEGENYVYLVIDHYEGHNLTEALIKKGP